MGHLYELLAETDIRLLTVSVHDGATASLELRTYPRTAAPEYDAVSYTWGDDTSMTSVLCNGLSLEIRTNLFRSLPFIYGSRPEPRTRPLWVDAICLDQNNQDEKAIHVPRMGDVYTNAERTLIWLGEAADNSDLAMDEIENIIQKMSRVENPDSLVLRQRLINYDLPLPEDQVWEAIEVLHLRPWVRRLWTLQEVVLAKEPIVLCGTKSIPWDTLVDLHKTAYRAKLDGLVYAETDPNAPFKQSRSAISHVNFLRTNREEIGIIDLPRLLTLSGDRGYALPVDRVWALIGMLNKRYQRLIRDAKLVNYEKDAILNYHKTFMAIFKFHVEHDRFMAMTMIEDNARTLRNTSMPSWAPDWHTNRGDIPLSRWPEACAGFPGGRWRLIKPFMLVNDDSSLELCGLKVDVVECVTASPGKSVLDVLDFEGYPWLTQCLDIIQNTNFSNPGGFYPEKFDMPAIPTTYRDGSPTSEQWRKWKRAEEVIKYVLYPPGTLLEDSGTIFWCNGRRFFRTQASRLGIGPADLQENDILCSMYGARTIWALRPRKTSEEAEEPQTGEHPRQSAKSEGFELVGSIYTPSLLKGQAWTGTSCESMERFRLY